jgi:hypothetical protein
LTDVGGERVGFLHGGEVAAMVDVGPAGDGVLFLDIAINLRGDGTN